MLRVIFDEESEDYGIEKTLIAAAKFLSQTDEIQLSVSFLSAAEIQTLNLETRGVDAVTDVLSFPTLSGIRGKTVQEREFPLDIDPDTGAVDLGCIAICAERAAEQSREYGHSLKREIHYLALHGFLHLLGYDHMTEEEREEMRKIEESVLSDLSITREI